MVTNAPDGAVSASQCVIAQDDPWTCLDGYVKTSDNQQCAEAGTSSGTCHLSLSLVPTNPSSPGMNDGKIVATYVGQAGAVSAFSITSPFSYAPTSTIGTTATFDGIGHNTYTVSVTDTVCTKTASVSLTAPTSVACSACPPGSTPSGNLCIIPNQTSCPSGFTRDVSGTCTLACTTGTALGTCALKFTNTWQNSPASPTGIGELRFSTTGAVGSVLYSYSPEAVGQGGVVS